MPGRLVLISEAGNGFTANVHTAKWASEFARRGWDVHVISLREGTIPGVTVHSVRPSLPGKVGYLSAFGRIRKLVRSLAPTLVHAHYATSYGLLAALSGRHPLVMSVWGCDVYEFPRVSPLHRAILTFNLRVADAITSTSHAMARETARYAPGRTIHVIPFGVDLSRFVPGEAPTAPTIGCVKALEPKYGQEYLIRAVRLLLDREPNRPLHLVLAGAGSDRPRLEHMVASLGLLDRVEFRGVVPHAEVPALMARLSLFAMPSVDESESFGVAAVEASACGLPVVASRLGGVAEVVADGQTGTLVAPRQPEALAQAIDQILRDPARARAMGSAGRERVETLYAFERNADQMEALYHSLPGVTP